MKRLLVLVLLAVGTTMFAQEPAEPEGKTEEAKGEIEVSDSLKWANFALLAIGLGYMLAKLLPKTFADRTATIQKDIKEAKRLKADAEKRAAEVEAKVAALGADIEKFRVEAAQEMAAEGDSRCGGICAFPAQKHVADGVLLEPQTKRLAPFQQ